jgi:O-antigen ligase
MLRGKVASGETAPALLAGVLALTVIAGVAGGASRENAVPLAIIELAAIPLGALALRRMARERRLDAAMVILWLAIAVPLLQLIPLPAALWEAAPGHAALAGAFAALGLQPGWAPLSLFPRATLGCALALLPPAAMFLAVRALTADQRRIVASAWIVLAALGLLLGAVQLTQASGGWAYLYATTNRGALVGVFANRNHEAGFLLALTPIAATFAMPRLQDPSSRVRAGGLAHAMAIAAAAFALVALAALGAVRSRAGLLLAAPAIAGSLALLAWSRGARRSLAIVAAAGSAALAVVAAVALFASGPILARFAAPISDEARFEAWPTVVSAARSFMPLGAGVGAFERVFRAAEPLDLVDVTFFNHAHNEYLELWLETGIVGPGLLLTFAVWFAIAVRRACQGGDDLQRAASIAVGLLLAQSVVDYPLRTETIACLFAFACGCLAARAAPRRPRAGRPGR